MCFIIAASPELLWRFPVTQHASCSAAAFTTGSTEGERRQPPGRSTAPGLQARLTAAGPPHGCRPASCLSHRPPSDSFLAWCLLVGPARSCRETSSRGATRSLKPSHGPCWSEGRGEMGDSNTSARQGDEEERRAHVPFGGRYLLRCTAVNGDLTLVGTASALACCSADPLKRTMRPSSYTDV